jgi:acetoacetyl-CoA reductase
LAQKKICLVTGGTGGIGSAISKTLSDAGFTVISTCRPSSELSTDEMHDKLFSGYDDIHIYPVDVSNFNSCCSLAETILVGFGPISVLINNAGITDDSSIKKMEISQWHSVTANNLDSVFYLSKLVFGSMCDQGWGRIVNISSINGQKGQFGQVNYAASKAGVLGFTKSLAAEGARFGVTVNSISPGYIETKMVMDLPEKIITSIVSEIPVGRLGKPFEIAHTVCYIVDEKSGFLTGSNIAINGGQHMF